MQSGNRGSEMILRNRGWVGYRIVRYCADAYCRVGSLRSLSRFVAVHKFTC
jgi:hypothetical protein